MAYMKNSNIYIIDDGDLFEGNFEQFQDCFFHAHDENDIKDWCETHGYKLEIRIS